MKDIKKENNKWLLLLGFLALLIILLTTCCRQKKSRDEFQYLEVTVDDIGKLFGAFEVEAILFMDCPNVEEAETIKILGDPERVKEIIGREVKAEKVGKGRNSYWIDYRINDITHFFKVAERVKRGYLDDARAVFITKHVGYMVEIAADDKVVYGPDYESEDLFKILSELGIIESERKLPTPPGLKKEK